ncbi:AraC family transcriptional activator FtrA [Novosphingobium sp. SG751A]|uniref:transcriptional regulator FtrA n=1 Tax=Novosphingobium sp. SG751A TaxID=2587000 RepID=UPI001C12C04D|nr:transcriptional regulator FtrA [Novosphingobium sp. SG751A]NOW48916.1 AraC family transcriptional activator FtrA [Novosphingobium sp. SG751A]
MPKPQSPLVVALLYDGLCTFEFGIVAEVFGLFRPEMGPDWYRFASAAIEAGPLRAHGGFSILPTGGLDLLEQADMVIVPGWKGAEAPVPEELVAQLRRVHARGGRLASICSGAFVLAATGLLDGKKATTHWRYAEILRQHYPAITVDEASLYHGEDNIFTSAGSAAGIDLMIEIVRQDYGPDAANSVARRIVMPAHRSGGQAQFLERPVRTRPDTEISPLLDLMRQDIHRPWTIALMARQAAMSRRTFERRFIEATGQGPGEWLAAERVEAAKDILIRTQRPMEEIAAAVGFGSAHALRHHFRARLSLSPSEYRREFGR